MNHQGNLQQLMKKIEEAENANDELETALNEKLKEEKGLKKCAEQKLQETSVCLEKVQRERDIFEKSATELRVSKSSNCHI